MSLATATAATAAGLALVAGLGGSPAVTPPTTLASFSIGLQYAASPAEAADPFPGVRYVTPAPGSKKIPYNTEVVVTFANSPANLDARTFTVTDARGRAVAGQILQAPVYGGASRENVFFFQPSKTFVPYTRYTVRLTGVIVGGVKIPDATWTFTTDGSRLYSQQY